MAYLKIIGYLFFICLLSSLGKTYAQDGLKIQWVDELHGDYSFTENWDYNEGINRNEYGQLVCDGLCDPLSYELLDEKGKIPDNLITRYYTVVDTTRYYHTIECEANFYEWLGTNYIECEKITGDTVKCFTRCNAATHSSLKLVISGDECLPWIELNSITEEGVQLFSYINGYIKIDKNLWEQNILKSEFGFTFNNIKNPGNDLWCKGKIFLRIQRD